MSKSLKSRFTRRSFLLGLGASAALPILAACEAQVVEKTVEVACRSQGDRHRRENRPRWKR